MSSTESSIELPIKSAVEMLRQIRVSTVLNSLLWAFGSLLLALVITSFTDNILIQKYLMWATGVVLTIFLLCFIGILLTGNFNLLRSERHILNMKILELLGDQSHTFKDFKNSPEQTNPAQPNPENITIPDPKNTTIIKK